jgi:hypothetical protein
MMDDIYKDHLVKALAGDAVHKEHIRGMYLGMYLAWMDHLLTVERFCEYYEISDLSIGKAVINVGRLIQEEYRAEQHKKRMDVTGDY